MSGNGRFEFETKHGYKSSDNQSPYFRQKLFKLLAHFSFCLCNNYLFSDKFKVEGSHVVFEFTITCCILGYRRVFSDIFRTSHCFTGLKSHSTYDFEISYLIFMPP